MLLLHMKNEWLKRRIQPISTRRHVHKRGDTSQVIVFDFMKTVISIGTVHATRRNVHGLTTFFFHFFTALHLCFILRTGALTAIRSMAFSLAVLPFCLQRTIPSEQVLCRLTTPARTSLPLLHHQEWMEHRIWECWLHRSSQRREASAAP